LKVALGEMVDDQPDRNSFSWAGKRNAIQLLQALSRAMLIPAKEKSPDINITLNRFIEEKKKQKY
jgi:adenine-specific DNA-methyltransferase